jgi:hypothetical protein
MIYNIFINKKGGIIRSLPTFPTAALPASGFKGIFSAPPLRAPPSLQRKGKKNLQIWAAAPANF